VRTTTVEVLITPGCKMVGRTLGSLRLRRRYGVYPLAVHRRNQNIGRQLDDLVVRVGDTLLLEGAPEDIQRLAADMELVDVSQPSARAYRRGHAPIVLAVLAGIVIAVGAGARADRGAGVHRGGHRACDRLHRRRRGFRLCRWAPAGADLRDAGGGGGAGQSGAVRACRGWLAPLLTDAAPFPAGALRSFS
jgi:hypothetical protein